MTYEEFSKSLERIPTPHKIRGSLGVRDFHKRLRKDKWAGIGKPVSEHDFYRIIRTVNNYLATHLINGNTVVFPYNLGCIELRKKPVTTRIVDNKLESTLPISWGKTCKLWYSDKEAFDKKILVRNEIDSLCFLTYSKYNCYFKNQSYYRFRVIREIKHDMMSNFLKGKIDTLW